MQRCGNRKEQSPVELAAQGGNEMYDNADLQQFPDTSISITQHQNYFHGKIRMKVDD